MNASLCNGPLGPQKRFPHVRAKGAPALMAALVCLLQAACGGGAPIAQTARAHVSEPVEAPQLFGTAGQQTCVVLSVGSLKGVAHAGAIRALREMGVRIDCVVGNSMGAIVGGLYASAPTEDPALRLRQLLDLYVQETTREIGARGVGGAILLGLFTGGWGLLVGGAAGVSSVAQRSVERFERVTESFLGHAAIETLPTPFRTFAIKPSGHGIERVTFATGSVAHAVAASAANALIFEDVNVRAGRPIDPGADRVSAVPVEEACNLFHDARLIVVNVTGEPAFFSQQMTCPMREIRIDPGSVNDELVFRDATAFNAVVRSGYDATRAELMRAGISTCPDAAIEGWPAARASAPVPSVTE
jgi:NTE family protein